MKLEKIRKYLYGALTIFVALSLSILFFFVLFRASSIKNGFGQLVGILMPFVYGGAIAYLLCPICNRVEGLLQKLLTKMKVKRVEPLARGISISLSLIFVLALIYILLALIIPQVAVSVAGIIDLIPSSYQKVLGWAQTFLADRPVILNYVEQFSATFTAMVENWLKTELLPSMQTVLSGFSSGVISVVTVCKNLFIGITASVYFLSSRKKFAVQAKMVAYSLLREKWADRVVRVTQFADQMFGGFIYGRILDSTLIGILCFIGVSVLKMPYPVLISVIVGVTNVIPVFGPLIGAVPSAILILMVDPVKCFWFIVFIFILQQIDGCILGPRISGSVTGLPGFWVLFAVMLFGGLFGFAGMVVGVPLFAVIYEIVRSLLRRGLARHGKLGLMTEYEEQFPRKNQNGRMPPLRSGDAPEDRKMTDARPETPEDAAEQNK